jgi:drug/metabolite transporter (DMT)-like permease
MIFSVIMSILFIILAVIFLMGKGDKLIAGYNTASEEEKSKVNIKRLRLLMAIICVITAGFVSIQPIIESNRATQMGVFFAFILVTMVFIILANTWAKKK